MSITQWFLLPQGDGVIQCLKCAQIQTGGKHIFMALCNVSKYAGFVESKNQSWDKLLYICNV